MRRCIHRYVCTHLKIRMRTNICIFVFLAGIWSHHVCVYTYIYICIYFSFLRFLGERTYLPLLYTPPVVVVLVGANPSARAYIGETVQLPWAEVTLMLCVYLHIVEPYWCASVLMFKAFIIHVIGSAMFFYICTKSEVRTASTLRNHDLLSTIGPANPQNHCDFFWPGWL